MGLGPLGKTVSRRHSSKRWRHPGLPRVKEKLRITSNMGLIAGQCILLFWSRDIGLCVIISSSLLSLPYFLEHRMWDVVALMVFLNIVNIVGLFVQ